MMIHEYALQTGGLHPNDRTKFIPVLRIEYIRSWRTVSTCSGPVLNEKAQACNGCLGYLSKWLEQVNTVSKMRHKHRTYRSASYSYPRRNGWEGLGITARVIWIISWHSQKLNDVKSIPPTLRNRANMSRLMFGRMHPPQKKTRTCSNTILHHLAPHVE